MVEYTLTLNSSQAKALRDAAELYMRLKLGQYDQIPYFMLDLGANDYCERRDAAEPHLREAFYAMYGTRHDLKDDLWYRLYNAYQVLRHAIWEAESPKKDMWVRDADEPMRFTDEPLPGIEWRKVDG